MKQSADLSPCAERWEMVKQFTIFQEQKYEHTISVFRSFIFLIAQKDKNTMMKWKLCAGQKQLNYTTNIPLTLQASALTVC